MHILHLTPYYKPAYAYGGVVRAVEGMATSLAARGHEITVLTTDALDQSARYRGPAEEIVDGVRVLRRANVSPMMRGRFNLSTPRSMKKTAEAIMSSIDIVHVHEFRTLENLLVTPVAAALKKPIVLSPHGTISRSTGRGRFKRGWDRLLGSTVAQRIDQVVALTESEKTDVLDLWGQFGRRRIPTRFSILPNGIWPEDFTRLPSADPIRQRFGLEDAPTVLYLGRLQQRKGVDVLVQAFQRANVRHSRLLIVGPDEGMLPTIQALADGDPRIICTGYLGGDERLAALAAGDIFALPAIGEGLSMAVLEAMAAAIPVVLSPGCNMPEVAPAGAGFLVEARADYFADKLQILLSDGALRAEMGSRARRLVVEKYSWERVAAELEAVYQQHVPVNSPKNE